MSEQYQQPSAPAAEPQGQAQPAADKPSGGKQAAWQPRAKTSRADRAAMADRLMGKEIAQEDAEKPSPKGKSEPNPAESTSGRAEGAAEDSGKAAPEDDAKADTGDLKSALADLLKKGDLGAIAEKLGVDKKAVDASSAKLRLGRQREEKAAAALKEANELRDAARREYGAPHKAREAYDRGDFHEAAEWVSQVLGDDFASLTRNIANATKGMNEAELKRFQKERELKQREAALQAKEKAADQKVTEEQRTARALKAIDAKCTGHDALKLKGGNRLIMRVLEESFDPETGRIGIGYKQAADQVLNDFLENAKALGLGRADEKKPDPPPKTAEKKQEPRGRREFPTESGDAKPAADGSKRRGMTLEERRARADRMFERGRP